MINVDGANASIFVTSDRLERQLELYHNHRVCPLLISHHEGDESLLPGPGSQENEGEP